MTTRILLFVEGPKSGDTYTAGPHDNLPTRIGSKLWAGHYELLTPKPTSISQFQPMYQWTTRRKK